MAIKAQITVDNSELKKGLKDAESQASKSMKNIQGTTNASTTALSKFAKAAQTASTSIKSGFGGVTSLLGKIGPLGMAAAAGITVIGGAVAGVFKGVGALTSKLDGISKSAKSVNMTANQYIALSYASSRAGVSMENVLNLIGKIDYALIQAADGEKKYVDAFHKIGLSWQELSKMSPDKYFTEVAEAMKAYKVAAGSLPREAFDIFGRKDMATINKIMNENNFGKFVAEAGALGFEIKPGMIAAAEAYQDVMSDTQKELLAMVSNMESLETLTKKLTKFWENIGSKIAGGNGRVREPYKENWEGISDVGINYIKGNVKNLSREDKQQLLQTAYYESLPFSAKFNGSQMEAFYRQIGSMSEEELQKAVDQIDFEKMGKKLQTVVMGIAEKVDNRFKANDRTTWVQRRLITDEEFNVRERQRAEKMASDDAQLLIKNLEKIKQRYEDAAASANKLVNVEREIARIEKDRNVRLDDDEKRDVRLAAAMANKAAIAHEVANLNKAKNTSFDNFYANMLGSMGANTENVAHLFKSLSEVGAENQTKNLYNSLRFQYFKNFYPKNENETNHAYNLRMLEMMQADQYKTYPLWNYRSAADFLRRNPMGFSNAFNGIARDFNKNNILGVGVNANQLYKTASDYNTFAGTFGLQQLKFTLDPHSLDPNAQNEAYDTIEQMLANVDAYKRFLIEETRKLYKKMRKRSKYLQRYIRKSDT